MKGLEYLDGVSCCHPKYPSRVFSNQAQFYTDKWELDSKKEEERLIEAAFQNNEKNENYSNFLDEIESSDFNFKNIPYFKGTIKKYFPKTKTNLDKVNAIKVKKILNRRILEANSITGREVNTWHKYGKVDKGKYVTFLDLSRGVNVGNYNSDTTKKINTLECVFSGRFSRIKGQNLLKYTPGQIGKIYSELYSRAIDVVKK